MILHTLYRLLAANEVPFDDPAVWRYQRVKEKDFTFDRAYHDIPKTARVAVHSLPVNEGDVFWHPHDLPVAVVLLSDTGYEVRIAASQPELDAPKVARVFIAGDGAYELAPGMWHAVKAHEATLTLTIFGLHPEVGQPRAVEQYPILGPPYRALLRARAEGLLREVMAQETSER